MPSSADRPAAAAGTWLLGDNTVNRMGFGAMRLTGTLPFHAGEPRDRETSLSVLRRAVDLGVDHLDTAAFYFSRTLSANRLIAEALSPYPQQLTIVTKVGPARDRAGEWAERAAPDGLRAQVEENAHQLGVDRLDVVNFRAAPDLDVTPYVEALAALVDEGLIGHVGVSGVTGGQLRAARAVAEVVCVQNRADDQAMRAECGRLGIAFVPFFTVSGSGRQGRPGREPGPVVAVARETGATTAQVRLAAALAAGASVLVIPGTGTVEHLEENVAAASLCLSDDQVSRLVAA